MLSENSLLMCGRFCILNDLDFKKQFYDSSWDRGRFIKNFRFDTICKNIQEPQELHNCACEFIGKSGVVKYLIVERVKEWQVESTS